MRYLRLLFGMQDRVDRRTYLIAGLSLFLLKYLGEASFYYMETGHWLHIGHLLTPRLADRFPGHSSLSSSFLYLVVAFSLPFIWIGVGMSIRRAVDAGLPPWTGCLFFVPYVNYLMMLGLAIAPSYQGRTWEEQKTKIADSGLWPSVVSMFLFAGASTLLIWISTNKIGSYGASLFLGVPMVLGLVQGCYFGRRGMSYGKTLSLCGTTVFLVHLFLLLFALEGAICLAMSFPICLVLASIGGSMGFSIGMHTQPSSPGNAAFLLLLPIFSLGEKALQSPHRDVVLSQVVIDASPETVWRNVVSFPELPPTDDWLFRLGVSYPLRARIEGTGVGATRYCEFSTGPFVEPITVWNEPKVLGFDVTSQPQPMQELSFYDHVDAPHLEGYFRSTRGEFRLTPTADGKTLLEGRTWYETDIHPGWYWQLYSRWFIHKIHLRVLSHIKNLSERA